MFNLHYSRIIQLRNLVKTIAITRFDSNYWFSPTTATGVKPEVDAELPSPRCP